MPDTPNFLEQRIKQCEDALGINGITSSPTKALTSSLPVGVILITATADNPVAFGTWVLLHSGNVLGGQVGTVYIWKRTS